MGIYRVFNFNEYSILICKNIERKVYFCVCLYNRIIVSFPKGVVYGTAVIWAKDAALTAGHCVYNPEFGGWAIAIELFPGQNNSESEDFSVFKFYF